MKLYQIKRATLTKAEIKNFPNVVKCKAPLSWWLNNSLANEEDLEIAPEEELTIKE